MFKVTYKDRGNFYHLQYLQPIQSFFSYFVLTTTDIDSEKYTNFQQY